MGIFDKIFGASENDKVDKNKIEWNLLTDLSQIEDIIEESKNIPIIIFKHSTRCGISRMALNGFERDYSLPAETIKPYFLDLLNYRDISNEVASRFGVWHESPQLLIIKNGEVVHHSSHGQINAQMIEEFS